MELQTQMTTMRDFSDHGSDLSQTGHFTSLIPLIIEVLLDRCCKHVSLDCVVATVRIIQQQTPSIIQTGG
ncbi:hypothetical protein ILYODFUR_010564 [Ilyodon furcidens]|uniref:Uncharacterized protein n=1 Tax=Ilyodon furcidens TaxID=33524 RepID=A0ABV0SVV1_9TELE